LAAGCDCKLAGDAWLGLEQAAVHWCECMCPPERMHVPGVRGRASQLSGQAAQCTDTDHTISL